MSSQTDRLYARSYRCSALSKAFCDVRNSIRNCVLKQALPLKKKNVFLWHTWRSISPLTGRSSMVMRFETFSLLLASVTTRYAIVHFRYDSVT